MKKPFIPLNIHDYVLHDTQIDLYFFSLTKALPETALNSLSDDEKKRADRFHFKHHQHHFKRARFVLRRLLSSYVKQAPKAIQFAYEKHGKPYLLEHPDTQFNLSHSGEYAMLAIGKKHPLGVDIERYSSRPYLGIGRHVFSDIENQHLQDLPPSLKPLMFFNTWAQKEAFIKLLGLGLSYPTSALTVPGLTQTPHEFLDPIHKNTWALLPFMPRIGYAGALCCHPSIQTIRYLDDSL